MGDAISNLGGGGLSTPYLANLANALNYACGCLVTLVGGPLINKLGIKLACLVAAVTMPLNPSAYYASARHGAAADAYLLASSLIGGLSGGFLYVAETSAMLSYPQPEDRGLYLGIWSAMRNTGSMLGGAVNFATSYTRDGAGGIPWSTYLVFVGFACTGVVWALLLSPSGRVRRRDGCPVPVAEGSAGWACEFAALWAQIRRRETWLVFLPAFYSFFYGGTMGTYLSLHFSVRARALSSLLVPSVVIPLVLGFGRLLDQTRWSQRTRAWIGFLAWVVPQAACFLWIGREYSKFGTSKLALDYGQCVLCPASCTPAPKMNLANGPLRTVTAAPGRKPTSPISSSLARATGPSCLCIGSWAPFAPTCSLLPEPEVFSVLLKPWARLFRMLPIRRTTPM